MQSDNKLVLDIVLAILQEAQIAGVKKMTRTSLVKFLYLVDAFTAEETEGKVLSGLRWRFLHFGPFSQEAASAIDTLVAKAFIEQEDKSANGRDFVLYRLADWKKVPTLEALGAPKTVSERIQRAVREYAFELPKLLDFVYFHTQPMENARPGDQLDFSRSRKSQFLDVKQVKMLPLDPKAAQFIREKLRQIVEERKKHTKSIEWPGAFDDAYHESVSALEDPSLPPGTKGRGKISF